MFLFFLINVVSFSLYIFLKNLISSKKAGPPKQGCQRGREPALKFSVDVPFLLMWPLNRLLREVKPKMYMKINKQNHEPAKVKLNTLKRSLFFV